jgi:hypothetical protein
MERTFLRKIVLVQACAINHLITIILNWLSFLISGLENFDSQLERDDNHSPKNFSDIITISICSLITKLQALQIAINDYKTETLYSELLY